MGWSPRDRISDCDREEKARQHDHQMDDMDMMTSQPGKHHRWARGARAARTVAVSVLGFGLAAVILFVVTQVVSERKSAAFSNRTRIPGDHEIVAHQALASSIFGDFRDIWLTRTPTAPLRRPSRLTRISLELRVFDESGDLTHLFGQGESLLLDTHVSTPTFALDRGRNELVLMFFLNSMQGPDLVAWRMPLAKSESKVPVQRRSPSRRGRVFTRGVELARSPYQTGSVESLQRFADGWTAWVVIGVDRLKVTLPDKENGRLTIVEQSRNGIEIPVRRR
jgi:hypothetical protein